MKTGQKFWLGVVTILAIVGLFTPTVAPLTTGANLNVTPVDFAGGITYKGTTVFDTSGNWIGPISVGSSKFTVASATGNTAIAGSLTYKMPIVTPTVDTTLTTAQSGTTFNLGTAGVDLTLPAMASSSGVHYRFVISAAYATTNITVASAEGDNIEGTLLVAGAVVDCDANDVITSVNDGENIGDYWDLYSNGTYWYIGSSGALTASKLTCSG